VPVLIVFHDMDYCESEVIKNKSIEDHVGSLHVAIPRNWVANSSKCRHYGNAPVYKDRTSASETKNLPYPNWQYFCPGRYYPHWASP